MPASLMFLSDPKARYHNTKQDREVVPGLFHVTRACRGVIFRTLETVRYFMSKTETTTGLKVQVGILG